MTSKRSNQQAKNSEEGVTKKGVAAKEEEGRRQRAAA